MVNRISILVDHNDPYPPSNDIAIEKFANAARDAELQPIIVEGNQPGRIIFSEALFIRTTTSTYDYTHELAAMMEEMEKPVIDSTRSIENGGNKVYIYNQAIKRGFPIPETLIISNSVELDLVTNFPAVVKPVHECFSKNIFLAEKRSDLDRIQQFPVVVQEFLYTPYDWRITILEGKPLFVCKYYMANDYWKVVDYSKSLMGGDGFGDVECVTLKETPKEIMQLALRATNECYGNDLFGVDIKEKDGELYLIEVNDNPSVDAGADDGLGDEIYHEVMQCFKRRIDYQ